MTVVEAGAVADVNTMAAAISLPSVGVQTASDGGYVPALEQYEGMLVRFTDTLTITEQFNLDQFGGNPADARAAPQLLHGRERGQRLRL